MSILSALLRYFPYEDLRKEQKDIILTVYEALSSKRDALIEAASGVGKTIAVLTATMPFVERGHKVIYLTRTHMETDKVMEELARISRLGHSIKGLIFRGRGSLCINSMVAMLPSQLADELCNVLRSFNACEYFVSSRKEAIDVFNKGGEELKRLCLKRRLCPYELLLNALPSGNVIVMTYSYLMMSELKERVFNLVIHSSDKAPIIVLDEAHNVQELVHSVNSIRLNLNEIIHVLNQLERLYSSHSITSFKNFIRTIKNTSELLRKRRGTVPIDPMLSIDEIMNLRRLVTDALYLNMSRGGVIIRGLLCLSTLLRLLSKLFEGNYVLLLGREGAELILEVFNPNPLALRRIVNRRLSLIAMSATLSPLEFYNKILGMRSPLIKRVPSPYIQNALFIIYTELNTSFKNRKEALYVKALDLITDLDSYVPEDKSIAVFVPSYEFLRELFERGLVYKVGRRIMTDIHLSAFSSLFTTNALYVSVLGGRLSEGIDLKVSLCLIVGVPYAKPDYRLMRTLKEYSKIFPGRARKYAYVFPAIRRAIQASGRLLRCPEDRGIVIFADERYVNLLRYFPRWMIPRIKVIKSKTELLKYVSLFSY